MRVGRFIALFFALVIALLGCAPAAGFDIDLIDDPSSVTDGPGDTLLRLQVISAAAPLAPTSVQVWLSPAGGSPTVLSFTHEDADSDGMVGAGDALVVQEPPLNIIGTADVGTIYAIEVMEDLGSSRVSSLWDGSWTAN